MADLRLTELLRTLDLAAVREKRHATTMMKLVARQYRRISMDEVVRQLREALDAGNTRSAATRTNLVLKALDIAVKELKLPPQRAEQIIRSAVRGRVQNLDELMRLQNPALSFNDPQDVQARAVSVARRDMNTYWAKEQKRFRHDVARTTRQAIRAGMNPEQAADLLQKRLNISRNRAVLIATDQMLTAAANADRQRQRDMGIQEYLWRTVGDARVRAEHRLRNGKRHRWDDSSNYPGKEIRCRCRALPLIAISPATRHQIEGETSGAEKLSKSAVIKEAISIGKQAGFQVVRDGTRFPRGSGVIAEYDEGDGKIYLNPSAAYWADAAEYMRDRYASGAYSSPNPHHVIHHEIGHGLHHRAGAPTAKHKNQAWTPEQRQATLGKVSVQAQKNPAEFVAEVYAALKNGQTFDEDVLKWYDAFEGVRP